MEFISSLAGPIESTDFVSSLKEKGNSQFKDGIFDCASKNYDKALKCLSFYIPLVGMKEERYMAL